jgi:hypothetical protein
MADPAADSAWEKVEFCSGRVETLGPEKPRFQSKAGRPFRAALAHMSSDLAVFLITILIFN